MALIVHLESAARKIRTTTCAWTPVFLQPQRLRLKRIATAAKPSRMRLQVLRRDGYECRSCNQTGDEITLEARPIRSHASSIDEMITLCVHCRNVAEQWRISASSTQEFLKQLLDRVGEVQ